MKREFLQNFEGLSKEAIDAIMDENGRDIERERSKRADYDTIKEQLAAANKQIEEFKGMDIDGVRKAAEEWKAKAEQAERDASERIATMEFNGDFSSAVSELKGRDEGAIRGALGHDKIEELRKIKDREERKKATKSLLEGLKTEKGYLYDTETPPPFSAGAGKQRMNGEPDGVEAAFAALNPGLFE